MWTSSTDEAQEGPRKQQAAEQEAECLARPGVVEESPQALQVSLSVHSGVLAPKANPSTSSPNQSTTPVANVAIRKIGSPRMSRKWSIRGGCTRDLAG